MIKINGFVYVTNSGGFTADSVITKIDISSEAVVKTIEVGQGPDFIVSDNNTYQNTKLHIPPILSSNFEKSICNLT